LAVLFIRVNWLERLWDRDGTAYGPAPHTGAIFAGYSADVSLQLLGPFLNRYGRSAEPLLVRALRNLSYFPASLVAKASEPRQAELRRVRACRRGDCPLPGAFGALLWMRFAAQYRGELSETQRRKN